MVIGTCKIYLYLNGNRSLKEKRKTLKRILDRSKNSFNVSIAEVGDNDLWQRATLGVAMVSNDVKYVNSTLNKLVNFIDHMHLAEIIDYQLEIY